MARIRRSEKTRELLLKEGINLLSEHGYHGTGLKLILDTVNVPKGSFYNYFSSKEHFVAEILNTYAHQLLVKFDAHIAQSSLSPIALLEQVYDFMVDSFEQESHLKGCLLGNMAAEIGGHSELCRESMRATVAEWKKRMVSIIEMAQAQGQIRTDIEAAQLADLLWCTWEGALLKMKIESSTDTVRQTLHLLLRQLLVPTT